MKRRHLRLLSMVFVLMFALAAFPIAAPVSASGTGSLSVMTYNMKNTNTGITGIANMVAAENPDVVGMQEVTNLHWTLLNAAMSGKGYNSVRGEYRGTTSWTQANECNPIFYKASKFNLHNYGTFWLSDTPNVKSKFSDSQYYRICTWVVLENKTTHDYFIQLNTHFDLATTTIFKQEKVLLQRLLAIEQNAPAAHDNLIITGDMNMKNNYAIFKYIIGTGPAYGETNTITGTRLHESRQVATNIVTNSFGNCYSHPSDNPIEDFDHIVICRAGFNCTTYKVCSNAAGSDHLPVVANLQFKP